MKNEQKINTGAIFKNDNKAGESHPDYKGRINVNGDEFTIALWVNESKSGLKYFAAKIEKPFVKAEEQAPKPKKMVKNDLPF